MSKIEALSDDSVRITLDEGVPYGVTIALTDEAGAPIVLTGLVCHMQARLSADDPTALMDKTEANGELVNGGAAGTITLNFTTADVADRVWQRAVFDVKVTGLMRALRGEIVIVKQVTI